MNKIYFVNEAYLMHAAHSHAKKKKTMYQADSESLLIREV